MIMGIDGGIRIAAEAALETMAALSARGVAAHLHGRDHDFADRRGVCYRGS
jgi:hypothetical protein